MFDNIFRLNPILSITPVEELSETQRRKFRRIISRKEVYGFLHAPPEARLTVKALNRKLADFLTAFRTPMKITDYSRTFLEEAGEEKRQFIVQLVLDSVLEVRHGDAFISGVDAVNKVLLRAAGERVATVFDSGNQTQKLTAEAMELALNSALRQPRDISAFLYNYNRIPMSREWRHRLPDEGAVARYLGLSSDGTWPQMPAGIRPREVKYDEQGNPSAFDQFWRYWAFRDKDISKEAPSYKVYINPVPGDFAEVFGIVRRDITDSRAYSMKIGRNVTEVLRADKFIVYFSVYSDAVDFANGLSGRLQGYRSQGVPFSHQVNPENPLITIGVDPPRKLGEANSWRHYITDKVALAIQGAWRSGTKDPMEHIHTYMRMTGIDSINWRPANSDWSISFDIKENEIERTAG